MAQLGIREYDAKTMWHQYAGSNYTGYIVDAETDLVSLTLEGSDLRVVKPDQLFGKRGKHGLLGIKLTPDQVKTWIEKHMGKEVCIDGITDTLTTFIIEPFVPHDQEFYLSFETTRDVDVINFCLAGGMEIEDNRDNVSSIHVGVIDTLNVTDVEKLWASDIDILGNSGSSPEGQIGKTMTDFIMRLFSFFREYGFVYLECNPFTIVDGEIKIMDMVAKVDNCAHIRTRNKREDITWVKPFGTHTDPVEAQVQDMDEKTMSSLKLHVLNPNGRIWMILGGGGASVVMIDTLGELGLADEVANYGELSGNPDTDSNREYSRLLVKQMLASDTENKYLIVAGGIANFTYIDSLMTGVCDALKKYSKDILDQGIKVLVRRGGLRDKEGLAMVKTTCDQLGIPIKTADGNEYMTDFLQLIS